MPKKHPLGKEDKEALDKLLKQLPVDPKAIQSPRPPDTVSGDYTKIPPPNYDKKEDRDYES